MPTTYTPENAKLEKLIATNARVDDLLLNGSATGAANILGKAADQTDNKIFVPSWLCGITTDSLVLALTRNAAGDYSHNGTANGAENIFIFASMPARIRSATGKGAKLTSVKSVFEIGVADATSLTLVVNQATHTDRTAIAVAAHGGTVTFDANHDTAGERAASAGGSNPHAMTASLGTPAFNLTSLVEVTAELQLVMQNNGTFKFYGFEFNYTSDYL